MIDRAAIAFTFLISALQLQLHFFISLEIFLSQDVMNLLVSAQVCMYLRAESIMSVDFSLPNLLPHPPNNNDNPFSVIKHLYHYHHAACKVDVAFQLEMKDCSGSLSMCIFE